MAEWSNVPDSKSGVGFPTVGSNPTLSARRFLPEKSFEIKPLHVKGLFYLYLLFVPVRVATIPAAASPSFEHLMQAPLLWPQHLQTGRGAWPIGG